MAMTLHAQIDPGPPETVTGYLNHDPAAGALDPERVRPVDDQAPVYNPATHVLGARQEAIEPTRVVWTYQVSERPLADVQVDLCARIDQDAGVLRGPFTTTAHGQPETYVRKQLEASAVKDDPAPVAADYPLLEAGIGSDVPDTGDLAADLKAAGAVVQARARDWAALAKPVETPRLQTKRDIEAAETVDAAWAAYQAVAWPSLQSIDAEVRGRRRG